MNDENKIRPLPWQKEDWARIEARIFHNNLPHALLLAGPSGLGKAHFAGLLAARLLCQHPEHAPQGCVACGECHGCKMRMAGSHPDMMSIAPAEKGKLIRIDAIRSINAFLSETAQQGGYRIIQLEDAESMTIGAANAVLKKLEEPGEKTLFILLSDIPSRIMPTILSRCQKFVFTPPKYSECREWLSDAFPQPDVAEFWWRASGGMPLAAVELGSAETQKLRKRLTELFDALVRGADPVSEAAQLDHQQLATIIGYGIGWLEDLIRLGLSGETSSLRNTDMFPLYQQAVKNGRVRDWFRLLDYAREQRRLLAQGGNPNAQLVLESWLIRWSALLRS